jgi:cell division protein FtsQ
VGKKGGELIPFERKPPNRRGKLGFLWRFFLPAVSVILICALLLFYLPIFNINEIVYSGNQRLKMGDLSYLTEEKLGENIFRIRPQQIEKWVKMIPWVKDAKVQRVLPDQLHIEIVERKPAFLVPYYTTFLLASSDGVILGSSTADIGHDLPIITGLKISDPAPPGSLIDDPKVDKLLGVWGQLPATFLQKVAEIHLQDGGDVVFYFIDGLEIVFGQVEAISEKLELIHKVLEEAEGTVKSINVWSGKRAHVNLKGINLPQEE